VTGFAIFAGMTEKKPPLTQQEQIERMESLARTIHDVVTQFRSDGILSDMMLIDVLLRHLANAIVKPNENTNPLKKLMIAQEALAEYVGAYLKRDAAPKN
jgi:hypothetical protein